MTTRIRALVAIAVLAAGLAACGGTSAVGSSDAGVAAGTQEMCVEIYSAEALTNREVAFDGTVSAVSDDEVTFAVNEWFKGGSGDEITLEGATALGGFSSVGDAAIGVSTGERLLVSGDGGFAWTCGFTKPYSAALAAEWKAALAG